jgi:hypothetical protein
MKKALLFAAFSFVIFSCDKEGKEDDSIKLAKTEFSLYYEDEAQIEATSIHEITYESQSEYVATVSQSGLITGGRVGETNVTLNNGIDTKLVKIVINPRYDLYPEPIKNVKFGDSKQSVKATYGNPSFENTSGMIYSRYYSIFDYVFLFDKDGKIGSLAVTCPTLQAPSNLSDFLLERYKVVFVNEDDYDAGFLNEKEDMLVSFSPSSDMSSIYIMYIPYSKTKVVQEESVKSQFEYLIHEFNTSGK